ncbi:hypothetical protein E1301_Tti012650 [Triplophysa tibetana]|uniref:Uncharacterized protein n=1 Tax=Triplophysa tibetana TaxID=1572043 RepID=A0A5A9PNM8_9TELE|nr:hypothetical protein E1301_Tti012650 [Triplophysa tibetana]
MEPRFTENEGMRKRPVKQADASGTLSFCCTQLYYFPSLALSLVLIDSLRPSENRASSPGYRFLVLRHAHTDFLFLFLLSHPRRRLGVCGKRETRARNESTKQQNASA